MSNQYVDFDEKQREVESKVLYFDELSNVLNERRKLKVISRSIAPIVKYCKQLAYVPQQEQEEEQE